MRSWRRVARRLVAGFFISISRRAGARALNRFSEAKQQRVKNWIERYDAFAVLVATLLPPPFPFKLFVVTAGVFRFSLLRFMLAIIVGRAFRFLLEGYFAVRYGAEAKEILAKYYPWIGLGLVVAIVLFVMVKRWIKRGAEGVEERRRLRKFRKGATSRPVLRCALRLCVRIF